MELKRVVVTGIGAITPLGNNVNDLWNNIINGVSGANIITRFNAKNFKTKFACEVKNFNPEDYVDRKEAKRLDLYSIFALISVEEAIKDACLDLDKINKERVGVIFGSGIGGFGSFYSEVKNALSCSNANDLIRLSPFFIPKIIPDIAAGHISIKYGFMGPNYATVSACATSTHAIIDAFNLIRLNKANIIVAGGAEAAINEPGIAGFNSMQAISTNNEEYQSASRPFDKTRDGFVMGEGSGTLILESLDHAKERGAKIYAEIAGGGMTADAYHITAPHPEGLGAANVMKATLADANLSPNDIDYINTHGTATPLGDISEVKAIIKVFGEHAYNLNISSTKSMTGHLLGAAGAIEAIITTLAIKNNIIPPTINLKEPDPEIDQKLNLTPNKAQKKIIRAALSNTFGFGGHNSSIIIKKFVD